MASLEPLKRTARKRPGLLWILTATLIAVFLTYGVAVLTSIYAQFVHNDQYTLVRTFGIWELPSLIAVIALPVWLTVAVAAVVAGRKFIALEQQTSVRPWCVCLAIWAGLAALILAIIPWSAASYMDLLSLSSRELVAPLFPLAGIDAPSAILLNSAIFAAIGAFSGGAAILTQRLELARTVLRA